jgi:prolipoprotein diacylglyceryltransferase
MAYPHAVVGWPYPPGYYVHPTPVYETILYTLTFFVLWRMRREPHRDGTGVRHLSGVVRDGLGSSSSSCASSR